MNDEEREEWADRHLDNSDLYQQFLKERFSSLTATAAYCPLPAFWLEVLSDEGFMVSPFFDWLCARSDA